MPLPLKGPSAKLSPMNCGGWTPAVKRRGTALVVKWLIVVILLIVTALPAQAESEQPSSALPDVVQLTIAEGDSVLRAIDDLEIRLWECQQLAAQDSLYYEERLRLREESYEAIIEAYRDERDNWFQRLLKQPVVWFALGAWVTAQAN